MERLSQVDDGAGLVRGDAIQGVLDGRVSRLHLRENGAGGALDLADDSQRFARDSEVIGQEDVDPAFPKTYGLADAWGGRYEDSDCDGIFPRRQRQRLRDLGFIESEQFNTKARKGWGAVDDELKAILAEKSIGWLLETSKGTVLEPGNTRRSFAGMVKGTKFEAMKPYDLRHTFAQRLLDEGVDVKTAAELMRHSVEVFLARYVRSDRGRKMEAIKKLRKGKAAA